ncbi:MAG: methyltransferase domain-containing protein [Planctomycetota bacterium]
MRASLLERVACPKCRGPLSAERLRRSGSQIIKGALACESCKQAYPIVAGIPSFFLRPHPYPVLFLPPETLVPDMGRLYYSRKRSPIPFVRAIQLHGVEKFMDAVRRGAPLPSKMGAVPWNPSVDPISPISRREARRFSTKAFFKHTVNTLMKKRWWKDKGCLAFADAIKELTPRRLLDFATGPGAVVCKALLELKKMQAIALEIFFEKCRLVTSEARYLGIRRRLEVVHGDARVMPFPDRSFDCVSGAEALYHVAHYEVALHEVARVLRPGGHLVANVHAKYPSHSGGLLTRREEVEFIRFAHLPLSVKQVRRNMEKAGLRVIRDHEIGNTRLLVARKM